MEENQEHKSSRGGYRPGSGNKYKWKHGETKPVRIPIAIADEIVELAKAIDAGHLVPHDSVTQSSATRGEDELSKLQAEVDSLKALSSKLFSKVGELEVDLIKTYQQLKQTTDERDGYRERISDIELELENLKDDRVTQSRVDQSELQAENFKETTLLRECLESHQQQKFVIEEYRKENERLRQASALDPAAILNRLRKEHKKSKADLKDVELIAELLRLKVEG